MSPRLPHPPDRRSTVCRLLAAALLLVACTGQIAPPPVQRPYHPQPPAPSATPGGPLSVLATFQNEEASAFRTILAAFTAETGIAVEYEGATEVADALLARLEASRPPDIVLLPKPNWLQEMAAAGALTPLDTVAARRVRANYTAGWVALATHDGTLYGVPFHATSKSLVWFRTAPLAALGAAPPQTWAEWKALNAELAAAGEVPLAVPGGPGWPLTDWFENVLVRTAGPDSYRALIRHEIPWTDPAVRRAFETLGTLLRDDWLAGGRPGAAAAPLAETITGTLRLDGPEAVALLGAGWVGDFVARNAPGVALGRDVDFFAFPEIDRRYAGAVEGYVSIAVALNERPETQALLAFLATPEAAALWAARGGFVSPNRALDLAIYPDDFARREAAQLANATIFVSDLSDTVPAALSTELATALQRYLLDPASLDAILRDLDATARRTQGSGEAGER